MAHSLQYSMEIEVFIEIKGDFIKMRQDMRKLKNSSQIMCVAFLSLTLQGCLVTPKMAMDYLPQTAKTLIEKDIENGEQVNDQKENAVSVKSMLASVLGGKQVSHEALPTPMSMLHGTDAVVAVADLEKPPLPAKKPSRPKTRIAQQAIQEKTIQEETIDVIELKLDENIIAAVKENTEKHASNNAKAQISIGPVAEADSAEMASLQAMAKASAIGKEIREKFKTVNIKFNPLQPFGTVKIIIKG